MTITLKAAKLHEEISLLTEFQTVNDMLDVFGKPSFVPEITVRHEDGGEFFELPLQHAFAKRALTDQKAWLAQELEKRGIKID